MAYNEETEKMEHSYPNINCHRICVVKLIIARLVLDKTMLVFKSTFKLAGSFKLSTYCDS